MAIEAGKIRLLKDLGNIAMPHMGFEQSDEGFLIYDRSGWMSVQIVSDPTPTVPASSSRKGFLAAPTADKLAAVNGYYAHYGTWGFDASALTGDDASFGNASLRFLTSHTHVHDLRDPPFQPLLFCGEYGVKSRQIRCRFLFHGTRNFRGRIQLRLGFCEVSGLQIRLCQIEVRGLGEW